MDNFPRIAIVGTTDQILLFNTVGKFRAPG